MFRSLLDSGSLYRKHDEHRHEGMRLRRNQWLDRRCPALRTYEQLTGVDLTQLPA